MQILLFLIAVIQTELPNRAQYTDSNWGAVLNLHKPPNWVELPRWNYRVSHTWQGKNVWLALRVCVFWYLKIREIQGGSNMTGTNCDLFTHNQSRSYLNHLVLTWLPMLQYQHCPLLSFFLKQQIRKYIVQGHVLCHTNNEDGIM